jgi:membrane-bound lytic murein transglycosylase A
MYFYRFRQKRYLIPLLSIFILIAFFVLFKKTKSVTWTRSNSLLRCNPDKISDNLPGTDLAAALNNSIKYFNSLPRTREFHFNRDIYTTDAMLISLNDFKNKLESYKLDSDFFDYLRHNYKFYKSAAGNRVLFTGYYEVILEGSLQKDEVFKYPLYQKPDDLVKIDLTKFSFFKKGMPKTFRGRLIENTIIPYFSRKEIDIDQKLSNYNNSFVWLKSPIDRFFLHIQGSGIINLLNGGQLRVNYADSNGLPYRSIGRYLLNKGLMKLNNISMQSIKNYLQSNPSRREEILNHNPSYVFFRVVEDGPIGSLGLPVIEFRSIATDSSIFPRGSICYIKTIIPIFNDKEEVIGQKRISGFVLNQDAGGAIKSPSRVDLFTGNSKKSELIAGYLKNYGELYFLMKK